VVVNEQKVCCIIIQFVQNLVDGGSESQSMYEGCFMHNSPKFPEIWLDNIAHYGYSIGCETHVFFHDQEAD
jgi:hypothetical protein